MTKKMKPTIAILTLATFFFSCNYNSEKLENNPVQTIAQETKKSISTDSLYLNLTCLTEQGKELVIFESCDAGNIELSTYSLNDSFYILLHESQEDELFYVSQAYWLKSDTSYFVINYLGSSKTGLLKLKKLDSAKGTYYCNISIIETNYSMILVDEKNKNVFKKVKQLCKECWEEDEICEEHAKYDSIEANQTPIQAIDKLSDFWRTEYIGFDYPSSRDIIRNISKLKNLQDKDINILIKTYLNSDKRDIALKAKIVQKLQTNMSLTLNSIKTYKSKEEQKMLLTELKNSVSIGE